jgi:hypothetical protein
MLFFKRFIGRRDFEGEIRAGMTRYSVTYSLRSGSSSSPSRSLSPSGLEDQSLFHDWKDAVKFATDRARDPERQVLIFDHHKLVKSRLEGSFRMPRMWSVDENGNVQELKF